MIDYRILNKPKQNLAFIKTKLEIPLLLYSTNTSPRIQDWLLKLTKDIMGKSIIFGVRLSSMIAQLCQFARSGKPERAVVCGCVLKENLLELREQIRL